MINRILLRAAMLSVLAMVAVAGTLHAQSAPSAPAGPKVAAPTIKVGNTELKRFAGALKDVQAIQRDFQKSFQKAVTKSSLSRSEITKILQSERSAHKLPSNLSSNERQHYQAFVNKVVHLEQMARGQMVAVVQKDGFKVARFDAIVRAVNSDPTLAKRLEKMRK